MSILLISGRYLCRPSLAAPLALSIAISLLLGVKPAQATRLPAELQSALKTIFPDCRIRMDGAVESKDGELYLPILPKVPAGAAAKMVRLKETLPRLAGANIKTNIYVFDNGYAYVRVIKKLNIKTFPSFTGLPEKTHQSILSGHMPVDLIVPESFALPASMRPIVGDVGITLLKELPSTTAPATSTTGTAGASGSGSSNGASIGTGGASTVGTSGKTGTSGGAGTSSSASTSSPAEQTDATGKEPKPAAPTAQAKGSGHGFIFVTSPSTGTITLVAEDTMQKIAEVPTEGTPAGMALAGEHLYIADQSKNRILILDVKERTFLGQIDLPDKSHPKSVMALPNGKLLYVSESGLGLIAIVEVETSKVLLTTKVPPGPSRMAITPNGNTILILNVPTGQLTFFSTLNQKVLGTIAIGANPSAVVVAPDGEMAYVSCRSSGYVAIIDIAQKKMLGGLKAGNAPTGLAIDPEGKKLYVALAKDNKIAVFDLVTRALAKEITLPSEVDFPGTLCILPNGKKLVVSSAATQKIGILNIETGEFDDKPDIGHGTDETYFVPVN